MSLRCCTEDGSRPPGVGLQGQASNHPVLLRSKDVVVSDRGNVIRKGWQVSIEKLSESEPTDDASLVLQVLSKPQISMLCGMNRDETCIRARWQSV